MKKRGNRRIYLERFIVKVTSINAFSSHTIVSTYITPLYDEIRYFNVCMNIGVVVQIELL